jgi:hypothetical protein
LSPDRDPFDANQAVATLLTGSCREELASKVPGLKLANVTWLSLLAYPLSGGFRSWSLLPATVVGPLLWLEDRITPTIGRYFGFRLFSVFHRLK